MAIDQNCAWEVRPTNGVDTQSGGFVAGATGTDWSQQSAAQYSVTDGVAAGTTTITSATANFGTDVVGNIIYIQGGTGSITAGWYQITARTNSTTITVDRSTGLTAGTGVTLKIGGAMQSIPTATAVWTAGNTIYVKAEATITRTATITISSPNNSNAGSTMPLNRLVGYTTTRGDGGQVTIALSTNTGLIGFSYTGAPTGHSLENFYINCSSLGTSKGIVFSCMYSQIINCKVANFTSTGITYSGGHGNLMGCEITGGTSAATAGILSSSGPVVIANTHVHDNACTGISETGSNGTVIDHCLIANNTGASSDGIQMATGGALCNVMHTTVYGSGRDGFRGTTTFTVEGTRLKNNIFAVNGGYGMKFASAAGSPAAFQIDGNAYQGNTSGTRNNADDTTTNPINGVAPYVNVLDIICSVSPFTNAAGGDFTLNNTAGGGAAIRGHGVPASLPGATGTGYPDMGVWQHQDASFIASPPIVIARGSPY